VRILATLRSTMTQLLQLEATVMRRDSTGKIHTATVVRLITALHRSSEMIIIHI
jgi:hypothetical protein